MAMAKRWMITLSLVAVVSGALPSRGQDQPLVVQGGTLIDGNGGAPLKNAVVVIEGNRFKAVGVKGKVAIPPNAKVINAAGKIILPGLIDTEAQGDWSYEAPFWLRFGFTTIYWGGSPYMRQEKAAQANGTFKSPRIYLTAGGVLGPVELLRDDIRLIAKPWPTGRSVRTPEEARAAVDKLYTEAAGTADSLSVLEGFTPELLRVVTDQAHKHGLAVGGRAEFVSMTCMNGQDYSWHMASIVRSTITDPANVAKLKEMREKHWELYWPITDGNYAYMMEPATFDPLIQKMVQNHCFLAPTITHTWWGWGTQIPHAKEWAAEIIAFAKNTPGLDFVSQRIRDLWLNADKTTDRVKGRYVVGDQMNANHPRDMEGYAKRDEFLRRFVKAGGKLMGGADNNFDIVPGLSSHQELQQLVYSGLTPMQALLTVTKWAAESWHKDKDIGTVEPGKLADLITVNGDPLANIKNTRNVDLVIQNGKVMDTALDPNWKNPIQQPPRGGYQ
jgi:amidohydrolase family protein